MNLLKVTFISFFVLAIVSCAMQQETQSKKLDNKGLFPFLQNGKWGFIDKTGKVMIKPQFDNIISDGYCPASDFSEGLNVVKVGGKYGYINEKGEFAINPQFDYAGVFSEGLAKVTLNGKTGFIDKTGKFIINPRFDSEFYLTPSSPFTSASGERNFWYDGEGFSEGLAVVNIGHYEYIDGNTNATIDTTGYNYVDKKGETVDYGPFVQAQEFFEGLALISRGVGKPFFITKSGNGKKAFDTEFDEAGSFSEGLAVIRNASGKGYIDTSGKIVISPQFEVAEGFQEGLACVGVGKYPTTKFGFIDKTGKFVINPQFSACGNYASLGGFSDGLAIVKVIENGSEKLVYINKTGEIVIRPQTSTACEFMNGLAPVVIEGK